MASDRMSSGGDRARTEVEMQAWIIGIRPQLERRAELLFEQASHLEKCYLGALEAGEDSGAEGSCEPALGLRVRRCGDAIVRDWYAIDGNELNGEDSPPRHGFSGRAEADELELSCSAEDLLQHASGWDNAMAAEVENEVNQYRHWAHFIAEMLVNLERLQRLVHAPRGTSGGEQRGSRVTACEATDVAPAAPITASETAPESSSA